MKRLGKQRWRKHVADEARRFIAALNPDDVVLGGAGAKHLAKHLKEPPKGCRLGDNAHALLGGVRLWDDAELKKMKGT